MFAAGVKLSLQSPLPDLHVFHASFGETPKDMRNFTRGYTRFR
jgi:hypothetical protein